MPRIVQRALSARLRLHAARAALSIHSCNDYVPARPTSQSTSNQSPQNMSVSLRLLLCHQQHTLRHTLDRTNKQCIYKNQESLPQTPPPLFPSPSSPWPQLYTKTEKPEPGSGGQAGNKTTRGRGVSRMFGIPAGGYVGGGERERDTHREREGKRGVKLHREVKKHAASNTNVRTRIDLIW